MLAKTLFVLAAASASAGLAPRGTPVLVSRFRGAGADAEGIKLVPKVALAPGVQPRLLVRSGTASKPMRKTERKEADKT
ncbi:hypothetical protein T492DRAFT_857031 [Pavlovales sp. CCMP2436]|nr:hypothetical protein T492DRAFT_857031 [Pavlovales sp. CCMP2436]